MRKHASVMERGLGGEVTVGEAKAVARAWVLAEAGREPAVRGAFFHGSVCTLPDDAPQPTTSDVDVMVVVGDDAWRKPGKFRERGVLLEVSTIPAVQVASAESVLGQYNLAGSFRRPGVILDRDGHLADVQATVGREFARREWVERRCDDAARKVAGGFPLRQDDPIWSQTCGWSFPAGILTHILLVAGLRNPTVRTRYVAARALLADYGESAAYRPLLDLLGATATTPDRASGHLAALRLAFDQAQAVIRSPYVFAADISDDGRAVALDGTAELIAAGDHREAMFWLAATFCRCVEVLRTDAPDADHTDTDAAFAALLADLGIASFTDMTRRRAAVEAAVPDVLAVARRIMDANPDVMA